MKFFKRKTSIFAAIILSVIVLIAIITPFLRLINPHEVNPKMRLLPPSRHNLFGTDQFGRDILARTLAGSRVSLIVGMSVALLSLVFGIPLGLISGYFRPASLFLMRLVDALMAFPSILLALALMAILGKPSIVNVIIAVGIVYIPRVARLVYSATLVLRETTFVEAARAIGSSTFRILWRHILVNLISIVIVQSTFTFAFAVLEAAALDFLGVGIPPEIPSWGGMINENRLYLTIAPWTVVFPGFFLLLTVLSLNLLGDNLRDFLDPYLRRLV